MGRAQVYPSAPRVSISVDGVQRRQHRRRRSLPLERDPEDPEILGYFDWWIELTLTVHQPPRPTTGTIHMQRPTWSDEKDEDNYRRVAREAPDHNGFLPPP